jgi:Na+/melibiose symporter-like transporter
VTTKWFPPINTTEQARKSANQGALGLLIFTAMYLLGAAFAYFANRSPVDGQAASAVDVQNQVLGNLILVPLLLFFSYRVHKGKGWLACTLALLWFAAEAVIKLTSTPTNVGWIFFSFCGCGAIGKRHSRLLVASSE